MKHTKVLLVCASILTLSTGLGVTAFAESLDSAEENQQVVQDSDYLTAEEKNDIDTANDSMDGTDTKPQPKSEGEPQASAIDISYGEIHLLNGEEYTYSGADIQPEIRVVNGGTELEKSVYKISYQNNRNAGVATVRVEGNEEAGYTGKLERTFRITPMSVEKLGAALKTTEYAYDGKAKHPEVNISYNGKALTAGSDYTVSYVNDKEIGTASVTLNGTGNYSGKVTLSYRINWPQTVLNQTTPVSVNKIKLTWKKVAGASGYCLYRKTSSSASYKLLATVTSPSAVSYTDASVKAGRTYYYRLRPYRNVNGKKVWGNYSVVRKQKACVATPVITKTAPASYQSIKVTWKKVPGASGYAVYRSISPDGKYKRVGSIKGGSQVSYTDKNRTCGTVYYYKVCAYRAAGGKNAYGYASDAKSGKAVPSKVSFSIQTEPYGTKVILKWDKTKDASGYVIYRSSKKNGKYTKIKTITKADTVKWTDSGLKKGNVYYYKIRAYRNVKGEKVYSSYSAAYKKDKGGWVYKNGYKLYYNSKGKLVKDVSSYIGKQNSYVLKVNKQKNVVTVYAKDGKNGYIIPVKAFVCATGQATPVGTFHTPQKYRWLLLVGPCYGQWCTGIQGDFLFHSSPYKTRNNQDLDVPEYNKLGTTCSHGCVRLQAGDAKWIYDNCKIGTEVVIYRSSYAGPLGKPSAAKLSSQHKWDPTDPNMYRKCQKNGCH